MEEISFVMHIFEWRAGREVVWDVCHSGRSGWVYTNLAVLFNPVTTGFQSSVCVGIILVFNVSACEGLEIICIADYTYL